MVRSDGRLLVVAALLAAGCSLPVVEAPADGAAPDQAPGPDLAAGGDDAAMASDEAAIPVDQVVPDLAVPADLTTPRDRSITPLDATVIHDQTLPADLSAALDLAAVADATSVVDATLVVDESVPGDLRGPCTPVINEVQTGTTTSASEEFVELYNPCGSAIDLTGWHIVYRSAANGSPKNGADSSTLYIFGDGGVIASQGYLVFGGSKFLGTKDDLLAASMADPGGGVGLRNAAALLVDSVGYGSATNAFIETTVTPAHPVTFTPGRSIGRLPNGHDSDDNSVDFVVLGAPSPRLANQ